jgi:hypothetical protein
MYLSKNYLPTYWSGCNAFQAVEDWSKVRKLVRDAIKLCDITPILIEGEIGNGSLLTGTHRSAANDILKMLGKEDYLIPYIRLQDIEITEELQDALENNDFETIDILFDR